MDQFRVYQLPPSAVGWVPSRAVITDQDGNVYLDTLQVFSAKYGGTCTTGVSRDPYGFIVLPDERAQYQRCWMESGPPRGFVLAKVAG